MSIRPERTARAPRACPYRTDWRQCGDRRARAPGDARVLPGRPRHAGRVSPRWITSSRPMRRTPRARSAGLGGDRGGDVAQEHDDVAVSRIERDPRERARICVGPAREKGRLAVPGGRPRSRKAHPPCSAVRSRLPWRPWRADRRCCEFEFREIERHFGGDHSDANARQNPALATDHSGNGTAIVQAIAASWKASFHANCMRKAGALPPILRPQSQASLRRRDA